MPRRNKFSEPARKSELPPANVGGARRFAEVPCPHYPRCVGCPLIDIPYPQQLAQKRTRLEQTLASFPALRSIPVEQVVASPQRLGYRARAKLVVRKNRDQVALGLYVPGSHSVSDISCCPLHPPAIIQVSQYLKKKIPELGIVPYDERDDSGDLRYLDFRYGTARRELSVTLVTRRAAFPQGAELARSLMRRFTFVIGVMQNINDTRGNVIWGASHRTLAGRDTLMERFGDLKLVFPSGVFSQANPFTARRVYDFVFTLAALHGNEAVLDLYCGVGPIALSLAGAARQVWAVDDSEDAITAAKQNARRNGRGNCRFFAGEVAATVAELRRNLPAIDLTVVNPPRKGLSPEAMKEVVAVGARKLIYVSCEPGSLGRDLDRLRAAGYGVMRVQPFDMFPQTAEVEAVVSLHR